MAYFKTLETIDYELSSLKHNGLVLTKFRSLNAKFLNLGAHTEWKVCTMWELMLIRAMNHLHLCL
jgi:hypothetical protein